MTGNGNNSVGKTRTTYLFNHIFTKVYPRWLVGSYLLPHQPPYLGTPLFVSTPDLFLPLRI